MRVQSTILGSNTALFDRTNTPLQAASSLCQTRLQRILSRYVMNSRCLNSAMICSCPATQYTTGGCGLAVILAPSPKASQQNLASL